MDKDTLLSMDIDSHIEYLNSRLNEGLTVAAIRKELGIGKERHQRIISKGNYEYNTKTKNYIKVTEVVQGDKSNQTVVSDNYNQKVVGDISNQVVVPGAEYKKLIDTMKNLKNMNDKLEEMYSWYELQTKVVERDTLRIEPNNNDTVTRSFKVYKDIYEDFMKLSKEKYSTYKMQDLISHAIREFCDKYK